MRLKNLIVLALAFTLCLSGCGSPASDVAVQTPRPYLASSPTASGTGAVAETATVYNASPFASSSFHASLAEGNGSVSIDLSAVAEGYVAVSAVSEKRLKFQVIKDEAKYNYDLASDGTPSIFPLQCGDGEYQFRVMENVVDSKYAVLYSINRDVALNSEFEPFLRPSDYVSYTRDSQCVRKAAELAGTCSDALDLVSKVYEYVCSSVTYDHEKARSVQSGYLPLPDETMSSGKGICFDYASLAAAMLRSQGIPTKLVLGYVSPNDTYHAWNMFYTEETGWVAVKFEVSGKSWVRLDLTFAAGGAGAEFIGDGSNYSDLYYY